MNWNTQNKEKSTRTSRRRFLAASVASGFGVPLFVSRAAFPSTGKTGANDRITIGAIGVGHRAQLLLQQLPDSAQVVALADCHLTSAETYKNKCGANWPVYQDYRRLLDRKDIDAVIVATGEFQRICPAFTRARPAKTSMQRSLFHSTSGRDGRWSMRYGASIEFCRLARNNARWK